MITTCKGSHIDYLVVGVGVGFLRCPNPSCLTFMIKLRCCTKKLSSSFRGESSFTTADNSTM